MLAEQGNTGVPAGYGDFLLTSLLIVVLVFVLVWAVARLGLKRFQQGPGTRGPIRVLAQTALQQRHALHVVEVGGKTLLIGTSEQGMCTLAELDPDAMDRELLAERARPRAGFAAALQAALGGARWQRRDGDRGAAYDAVQESPGPGEPEPPPTYGGTEELDPGMTDELRRVPMFPPPPASPAGAARRSRRHG